MNKVIHFTHTDLDGVACSVVAQCFFDDIETHSINYGQVDGELEKALNKYDSSNHLFIISDLSYSQSREDLTTKLLRNHCLYVADHHVTSMWMKDLNLSGRTTIDIRVSSDGNKCGAEILYELLSDHYEMISVYSKEKLEKFLKIVSDWDVWKWTENMTLPLSSNPAVYFSNAYSMLGFDRFLNRILRWLTWDFVKVPFTKKDQENIENYNRNQEFELNSILERGCIKNLQTKCYGTLKVLYYESENFYQSLIGLLASKTESYKSVDLVFISKPTSISLRFPKPDIDLTKIASEFGGGGHRDAAGLSKDGFDFSLLKDYE